VPELSAWINVVSTDIYTHYTVPFFVPLELQEVRNSLGIYLTGLSQEVGIIRLRNEKKNKIKSPALLP